MNDFIIKGSFKAGSNWEKFTKTVTSNNEKNAIEKTYSIIGSQHGLKRRTIKIDSVEEVTT
jgi:large subunit ribosomal protein LX